MTKTERKLFNGLHIKLMELMEKDTDIFFKERPFLVADGEPIIQELEEARQNQIEIEFTVKALQKLIKSSLPPMLPPSQQELL